MMGKDKGMLRFQLNELLVRYGQGMFWAEIEQMSEEK